MADDLPQDGTPPELEMDPETDLFPLQIRPFDLETYRPAVHVLLPDGLRQFRSFERGVAPELLLREPTSHLSFGASEGDSHTIRGYGNVIAQDWYLELPDAVRHIVDEADFDIFCRGLSRLTTCRPLLAVLVERWWDTTNSFHFSAAGDMTMTPYDFSMLTGIGVRGDPIPFGTDMGEWDAAQLYLLGTQPPLARAGFVRTTLFADRANIVPLCLLSALVDVRRIRRYDWGGAGLATLYGYMSSSSRLSGQLLGGYWQAWELWVYAYFPRLAPVPDVETPLGVPFSHRFDVRCVRRPRESFIFFHRYIDTIPAAEISWRPWAPLPAVVRDYYEGAEETARCRILLEGSVCRAWYLGERFLRQTLGLPEQIVPGPPPTHMRHTEGFSFEHMRDYTVGWGAECHRGEGNYVEERPAAPTAGVGAGAGAGAGASRRARVRGRGGVQRGRGVSWPSLPTILTCQGQGGATYQIPFAPPPTDHELVGFYDLPLASSEYTWQSLELNASMMGMLQRTFDLLALYGIPPPFPIPTMGGVLAGPSIPARGGRGDAVRPRTRAGRVHVGSSSRASTPDDDDDDDDESEAEAEAGSSEEVGDDSDSGSDDDADDDAPGPSSRKRVRIDPRVQDY
ncbi:hypothetical protein HYC85_029244 [Camellia sinensis]|uniref:Aminotransferase-like plant mobile domain-containing protein n=1 Tax=Camellia sinensis TaxID=4442 RepID=A0A7J7FXF9_CAMSI|nr:hypothetical protein HYC85_029244 [Camellia sinensis]